MTFALASDRAPTACQHLQIEKRNGKTYCRDCKRQLYL